MLSSDGFRPMEMETKEDEERPQRQDLIRFARRVATVVIPIAVILVGVRYGRQYSNVAPSKPTFSGSTTPIEPPPVAWRDEDHVVQVGVAPADWNSSLPRQSAKSTNELLDPPKFVKDPYGWLRDDSRSDPKVLEYLHEENRYTQEASLPFRELEETLYQEIMGYIQETSHSFPVLIKSYYYYRRTLEDDPYPVHCRAPRPESSVDSGEFVRDHLALWDGTPDMPILPNETVYLDENEMSEDHEYFEIGSLSISPSQDLVAYTIDYAGDEIYQVAIQRIETGEVVFDGGNTIVISEQIEWGADDDTIFYTKLDEAQRSFQVYRYTISSSVEDLLYEEPDITYWVGIAKSMDRRYLLVEAGSSEASEIHYLDLLEKDGELACISTRRPNVLYSVEHLHGTWWMLSDANDPLSDLELWTLPVGATDDEEWMRVASPEDSESLLLDGVDLEDLEVFDGHVVLEGREDGSPRIWVLEVDGVNASEVVSWQRLQFSEEPAHTVALGPNRDFNATSILVTYESLVTPMQQVQVDLLNLDVEDGGERLMIYETPAPGYQKELYGCKRIEVPARDGKARIPVSLVYRESTLQAAKSATTTVPIHLYAYGAYGESVEDTFSSSRLPLLDRGSIYAIAHVRGGGELGRQWHESGKLKKKHHTFDDFVDVGKYLVDNLEWTTPAQLSCEGRSAGGLTVGASLNKAPELFRAAILGVPFVDLIVTMMDASIPLTTGEWEEWGNPNEAKYFDAMMDYSPVNNVKEATYPSMLILAGLHDPRVAYWEPAKLTATLRHTSNPKDDRLLCLRTDMDSGHFSASDRYKHVRGKAFEYAFLIDQLGLER